MWTSAHTYTASWITKVSTTSPVPAQVVYTQIIKMPLLAYSPSPLAVVYGAAELVGKVGKVRMFLLLPCTP